MTINRTGVRNRTIRAKRIFGGRGIIVNMSSRVVKGREWEVTRSFLGRAWSVRLVPSLTKDKRQNLS